ncbi:hypothetical protein LINPERHAP2_LOCUS35753, partial [Linum perenne]
MFLCLIPKKEVVSDIKDLRPISLVSCLYNIISKVLERLRSPPSDIISKF